MKEFNVLNPTTLYEYLDKILHTTKELCIDENGFEYENQTYYTPMICFNTLDIVLTNFDYNSCKAKYSINLYYREPYEDCINRLVLSFNLTAEELNNLDIIKQKFIESCKQYLLEQERENIQQIINLLSKKLIKEDIDKILNEECNGIMFSFKDNELYLVKDTSNFTVEK